MDKLDLLMLENQLSHSMVKVEFIKLDGTYRIMVCTKSTELIPVGAIPTTSKTAKDELLKVYDVESQGWRSMRKDRIRQWELYENRDGSK